MAGFEPATSSSQTRRDDRATLHPDNILLCHFAESERFELSVSCPTLVFKTSAFDHSANSLYQHLSVGTAKVVIFFISQRNVTMKYRCFYVCVIMCLVFSVMSVVVFGNNYVS